MHFKQYQTSTNDDGSINVHDVEIFKLGKHKGFDYSYSWAQQLLNNHRELEQTGYLPSVIIGHNDGFEEKPARGFLQNIRLEGDVLKADITKIPEAVFQSLKNREYPHRSVEVNPEDARITALALLGGTPPYHKLPIMEFSGKEGCEIIEFNESPAQGVLAEIRQMFAEFFERFKPAQAAENATTETKEEDKGMSEVNFAEEFAAKHGITPEEAVKQLQQFKEQAARQAAEARKQRIAAFAEQLKTAEHVAPAVVDEIIKPFMEAFPADASVKFDDKEFAGPEAVEALLKAVFAAAKENKLFVDFEEKTRHADSTGDNPLDVLFSDEAPDFRKTLHNKALQIAEEKNITYAEALAIAIGKNVKA
jgi:hypothetical protein